MGLFEASTRPMAFVYRLLRSIFSKLSEVKDTAGVFECYSRCTIYIRILTFCDRISALWARNMVKGFTKTYSWWRKDIRVGGTKRWWGLLGWNLVGHENTTHKRQKRSTVHFWSSGLLAEETVMARCCWMIDPHGVRLVYRVIFTHIVVAA